MSHLAFFHGYPAPLDAVAAFKHMTQMVLGGTVFDAIKDTAATVHVLVGGLFSAYPGLPDDMQDNFGAAGPDAPDEKTMDELDIAAEEFGSAFEKCKAQLEAQAVESKTKADQFGAESGEVVAINPMQLLQLLQLLYELWKQLRS